MGSDLEERFLWLWRNQFPALPEPVRQQRVVADRKWSFDFAWPVERVAVEIEGGMFRGHGHQRGRSYQKNCEKYNAAVVAGWRLLRYTNLCLAERPVQIVEEVAGLLKRPADSGEAR